MKSEGWRILAPLEKAVSFQFLSIVPIPVESASEAGALGCFGLTETLHWVLLAHPACLPDLQRLSALRRRTSAQSMADKDAFAGRIFRP